MSDYDRASVKFAERTGEADQRTIRAPISRDSISEIDSISNIPSNNRNNREEETKKKQPHFFKRRYISRVRSLVSLHLLRDAGMLVSAL